MKLKIDDSKALVFLQKTFYLLGWLMVIATVSSMFFVLWRHRLVLVDPSESKPWYSNFSVLKNSLLFFNSMATALFALLMSSLFRMLRIGRPARLKQTHFFFKLCCGSYAAVGILNLISWARFVFYAAKVRIFSPTRYESWASDSIWLFSEIYNFIQCLTPLLLALSIYILFRYFIKQLPFESEVA